jgi:hypothetical protein
VCPWGELQFFEGKGGELWEVKLEDVVSVRGVVCVVTFGITDEENDVRAFGGSGWCSHVGAVVVRVIEMYGGRRKAEEYVRVWVVEVVCVRRAFAVRECKGAEEWCGCSLGM